MEAFRTAYFNPDPGAAEHELERLRREFTTLPPRHDCTCARMNQQRGIIEYHCLECKRLGEAIPRQDVARSQGRSSLVHAPLPDVDMLDLAAAVLHGRSATQVGRWLNGEK